MLVDFSHPIAAGLVTYPRLPAPAVTDFLTREASACAPTPWSPE
jgi:hypothetical protein